MSISAFPASAKVKTPLTVDLGQSSPSYITVSQQPLQESFKSLRQKFTDLHAHYAAEASVLLEEKRKAEERSAIQEAEIKDLKEQLSIVEKSTTEWQSKESQENEETRKSYELSKVDHEALKEAYERLQKEKSEADARYAIQDQELSEVENAFRVKDQINDELSSRLKELLDRQREDKLEKNIGLSKTKEISKLASQVSDLQKELGQTKLALNEISVDYETQKRRAEDAVSRLKSAVLDASQWKARWNACNNELESFRDQVKEVQSKVEGLDKRIVERRVQILQKVQDLREVFERTGILRRTDSSAGTKTGTLKKIYTPRAVRGNDLDTLAMKRNNFALNDIKQEWLESDPVLHYLVLHLHKQSIQLSQVEDYISRTSSALKSKAEELAAQKEEYKRQTEKNELLKKRLLELEEDNISIKEKMHKMNDLLKYIQCEHEVKVQDAAKISAAYQACQEDLRTAASDKKRIQELENALQKVEEWKYTVQENERAAKEVAGLMKSFSPKIRQEIIQNHSGDEKLPTPPPRVESAFNEDQDDEPEPTPIPPKRRLSESHNEKHTDEMVSSADFLMAGFYGKKDNK